jgi:hypothetical protein
MSSSEINFLETASTPDSLIDEQISPGPIGKSGL